VNRSINSLALAYALRDLRGGIKGLRLLVACLILGVAAIAGVGSLTQAIVGGLSAQGQQILGGDLEVRFTQRDALPAERAALAGAAEQVSVSARMRAMARPQTGDAVLIELRTVDRGFPLYGEVILQKPAPLAPLLEQRDGVWGAVVDPVLADRLKLAVGDKVSVGEENFVVRGIVLTEPDRANEGFDLGPRMMINHDALPATGLFQPGSLVRFHYRLKTAPQTDLKALTDDLNTRFPDAGWQIRDRDNGAPGLRRFVTQMGQFLTLVGLTALMVAGVGVGNAVSAYLAGKTAAIATFKSLGASSSLIFRTYLFQIGLVAIVAIAIGLVIGLIVPPLAALALQEQIPVKPDLSLHPTALLAAALFGVLTTLAFALWPLARARELPAARLFRSAVETNLGRPRPRYLVYAGLAVLGAMVLAVVMAEEKRLALGFIAGAAGLLLVLRGVGWAVARLARAVPRPKQPLVRIAIANLYRPGSVTPAVVTALGLGLSLFATLAVIESNLSGQIDRVIPKRAPAFFFVDIPVDQVEAFRKTVEQVPGVGEIETIPNVRGRITHLNGVPADQIKAHPDAAWTLRGDRGLAYSTDFPKGNTLTQGVWWPADYSGPPLVSMEDDIAKGLGVGIGDSVSVNVLGVELTAKIANLRRVDWDSLGLNFVLLFGPGALENAPHTFLATVAAEGPAEQAVYRTVTRAFPTVSVVRMKEVLTSVSTLLEQISTAVRTTGAVTIFAGILVLIGAMAAGQQAKAYDAVMLKVLGASRLQVLAAYLLEYLLLGLVTGIIALGLGLGGGWFIVTQVLDLEWAISWLPLIVTVAGGALLTTLLGLAGTWAALSVRPNAVLRG
jgi:putative ABC transport system permease protein